jgi:alpha-mannosidase
VTQVFVVPHTHWDREWYEPGVRFTQRLVAVLDEVVALLESGSGLPVFLLDGQAILVEDYLAVRPAQRERIRTLVADGKLLIGPWYVLADELLSADETLVRNLLIGSKVARRLGNQLALGYSPDAFGHPAGLPTILAGFGIPYAIVWRGYGGGPGQNGDLFRWIGVDGAAVLVHHLPPGGYEVGANLPRDKDRLLERWTELCDTLAPRAGARPLLLMNGADHHGAQRDLAEVVNALNRIAGDHQCRIASPLEYFEAVKHESVADVCGELRASNGYTWTLQSIHSSRCRLKQAIAVGERLLLRWAEPQAVLAMIAGGADRQALLDAAWRRHLQNTFHDVIAGCTSDAVARAAEQRAADVTHEARGILLDALHDRAGQDRARARRDEPSWSPHLVVVNPSAHARSGVVEATVTLPRQRVVVGRARGPENGGVAPWPAPPRLVDADGVAVPMQVLYGYRGYERMDSPFDYPLQDEVAAVRVALMARDVPALGLRALAVRANAESPSVQESVRANGRALTGPWCDVVSDRRGGFALVDRVRGTRYPALATVMSERDAGDLYTHQPEPNARPQWAAWGNVRRVWGGPLIASLARDFHIGGRVRGTMYARLDAGSRLVRFVVEGRNDQGDHRLRVVFPSPRARGTRAVADMHYGPVARDRYDWSADEHPLEWPVDTAPMHRYVSVAEGLTVFARGLYEYELLRNGAIAITLFRAVDNLSRDDLPARPGHAGWPVPTPDAGERGVFRAELAVATMGIELGSSVAQWDELERLSEEFHAPMAGWMIRHGVAVPKRVQGPELSGDGLVLKSVKRSESGGAIVLRVANPVNAPVSGRWTCPFAIKQVRRVRLDETPCPEQLVEVAGNQIEFVAAPGEVVTLVVEPALEPIASQA